MLKTRVKKPRGGQLPPILLRQVKAKLRNSLYTTAGEEDHLLCFQDWEQTSFPSFSFFSLITAGTEGLEMAFLLNYWL